MLEGAFDGERGMAVRLSRVENYEDIEPLRKEGISQADVDLMSKTNPARALGLQ